MTLIPPFAVSWDKNEIHLLYLLTERSARNEN